MIRARFLLLLLGCALVGPADAGVPLRFMGWGDSGVLYTDNSVNCASIADKTKLVVSFLAPPGITNLEGVWGYVDLCTKPYPVVPWWTFSPYTGCRSDSLSANANFSAGPFSHTDPWNGRAMTTVTYGGAPGGSWEMARITVGVTVPPGPSIPLTADQEYYAFQIEFGNPDGGCGGCEIPACFVLNGLLIYHDGGQVIATEMDYSNWCTWQGGQGDCPFIVPTRTTTWGKLKESYR